MATVERHSNIAAPAQRIFSYVDDIRNLARHMSEGRSMAMMGSQLELEIMTPSVTGVGAVYRYTGRVLGFAIDFSEEVTRYDPPQIKAWRTIGELLILKSYEMSINVIPMAEANSALTVSISYELPHQPLGRFFGMLLARSYANWCLNGMIEGTRHDLEHHP